MNHKEFHTEKIRRPAFEVTSPCNHSIRQGLLSLCHVFVPETAIQSGLGANNRLVD